MLRRQKQSTTSFAYTLWKVGRKNTYHTIKERIVTASHDMKSIAAVRREFKGQQNRGNRTESL